MERVAIAAVGILQALDANEVCGHLSGQVAIALLRYPGVIQQQVHDALDQFSALPDTDDGDADSLLEQAVRIAGGGPGTLPPISE